MRSVSPELARIRRINSAATVASAGSVWRDCCCVVAVVVILLVLVCSFVSGFIVAVATSGFFSTDPCLSVFLARASFLWGGLEALRRLVSFTCRRNIEVQSMSECGSAESFSGEETAATDCPRLQGNDVWKKVLAGCCDSEGREEAAGVAAADESGPVFDSADYLQGLLQWQGTTSGGERRTAELRSHAASLSVSLIREVRGGYIDSLFNAGSLVLSLLPLTKRYGRIDDLPTTFASLRDFYRDLEMEHSDGRMKAYEINEFWDEIGDVHDELTTKVKVAEMVANVVSQSSVERQLPGGACECIPYAGYSSPGLLLQSGTFKFKSEVKPRFLDLLALYEEFCLFGEVRKLKTNEYKTEESLTLSGLRDRFTLSTKTLKKAAVKRALRMCQDARAALAKQKKSTKKAASSRRAGGGIVTGGGGRTESAPDLRSGGGGNGVGAGAATGPSDRNGRGRVAEDANDRLGDTGSSTTRVCGKDGDATGAADDRVRIVAIRGMRNVYLSSRPATVAGIPGDGGSEDEAEFDGGDCTGCGSVPKSDGSSDESSAGESRFSPPTFTADGDGNGVIPGAGVVKASAGAGGLIQTCGEESEENSGWVWTSLDDAATMDRDFGSIVFETMEAGYQGHLTEKGSADERICMEWPQHTVRVDVAPIAPGSVYCKTDTAICGHYSSPDAISCVKDVVTPALAQNTIQVNYVGRGQCYPRVFQPGDPFRFLPASHPLVRKHLGPVLEKLDVGTILQAVLDNFASMSAEKQAEALSRGNLPLTIGYSGSENLSERSAESVCVKPGFTNRKLMGEGEVGRVIARVAMALQNLVDEIDPAYQEKYAEWRLEEFAKPLSRKYGLKVEDGEVLRLGESITVALSTDGCEELLDAIARRCKDPSVANRLRKEFQNRANGDQPGGQVARQRAFLPQ